MAALRAYQMRPQRAEPLHDLAKHFRETGKPALGMLFAEKGLSIPRPDDRLFVADWVYEWGFREEASICGFYQEETKERGYQISNDLALDPSVPDHVRGRARRDMVWYLPRLKEMCPSTTFKEVEFATRAGFVAMNPCITNKSEAGLELLLRTVNYKIDAAGRYMIGPKECGDAPIETENHLLTLGADLNTVASLPVTWGRPEPKFPLVIGLEDMRIFHRHGVRHFYANVREQREDGQCVQYHGRLIRHFASNTACVEAAVPISDGHSTEKNWVPFLYGGPAEELVYRLDVLGTVEHHNTASRCCSAIWRSRTSPAPASGSRSAAACSPSCTRASPTRRPASAFISTASPTPTRRSTACASPCRSSSRTCRSSSARASPRSPTAP
jgi:hypothetical protein